MRAAADRLGLSVRQVKRLKKWMKLEGVAVLIHGNRGRKPNHAVPDAERFRIVQLALGPYKETSCQHMSELPKVGLRFGKKQARRRRSRERMPQEGMLAGTSG